MKISFILNSRPRKDNKQNIRIRITDGRNTKEQKVYTKINVFKKYWDKDEYRVTSKHPEHDTINRALKKLKDRKEHCLVKYDAGEYTMRQIANYMSGDSDYSYVDDYVLSIFKKRKTNVTFTDYSQKLNIIKGHMNISGKLRFRDINRDWFYGLFKKLKDKGLSRSSIRSYSIAIGSILKDAWEEGVIQELPKRPKEFKSGGKKDRTRKKVIKTSTPEDVEKAILGARNIPQLQSVGFWLLCYCLRGFYPADIVKMEEAELDTPTLLKLMKNELFIEHLRSKSEHTNNEHMYIHIDFKTTYRLIRRLKFMTAYTHHNRQSYVADVDDELKIYDYDPTENYTWHMDRWALHNRRLRPYGLRMKDARKTFLTKAKEIDVVEDIRLILVGRKNDPIFSRHYDNNETDIMKSKVTKAHISILKAFNIPNLVNLFCSKLETFNVPVWVKKEATMGSWSKLPKNNPFTEVFSYSKKYKWYFKGSTRFGQSKLKQFNFKDIKEVANKLEKLEKNKSNIIKLYPQLTMKDETTEPLLIMRNPDKDIV